MRGRDRGRKRVKERHVVYIPKEEKEKFRGEVREEERKRESG